MDKDKISRINFLARKSAESGLSDEERAEQAELRAQYIASFKADLERQLGSMTIVEPDGSTRKLKKKTN